jgi:hypothetical protein
LAGFPLFIIPLGTWAQPLQKYFQTIGSAVFSEKKIMEIVINWASEIKQKIANYLARERVKRLPES